MHEKKHLFLGLLINYEVGTDEEDRDPDWLSQKDPYVLAGCWRNYFNNQILDVIQDLWKDYHFIGCKDRIHVFGIKPYVSAVLHLERTGYDDPRKFLIPGKSPVYEPLYIVDSATNMLSIMNINMMITPHESLIVHGSLMMVIHLMLMILIDVWLS
ncbi:hypothetical protein SO802_010136 [Lithocarpus litseifolius]|uniref:Uncharacterized protein n=1 Tax=Lithocarpus litseifolius TaxID=425828 RepID=A0AAW2DGG5_9ROSI